MSTLTNTKIKDTYPGLIKTADNLGITATPKDLQDGLGNAINMQVLTGQINFPSGTVDFTGSTVNGLPIPEAPGLVAGTAANSIKSADFLTTTPAASNGAGSIAIGNGADTDTFTSAIAIGNGATISSFGNDAIAIGNGADAAYNGSIAIGKGTYTNSNAIAIGRNAVANPSGAVALGDNVTAATINTVTIKKLQMLDYATLNYADDAAAATGGIPLGGVYHTDGVLKIRIA